MLSDKYYTDLNLIAINNHMLSGSTLIHSLLDNHPQIASLPLLSLMQVCQVFAAQPNIMGPHHVVQLLQKHQPSLFDTRLSLDLTRLSSLGNNQEEFLQIDHNQFLLAMFQHMPKLSFLPPHQQALIATCISYNQCLGRDIAKFKFIQFPTHSLQKDLVLFMIEPFLSSVKIIHTLRDPIDNFMSTCRHRMQNLTYKNWRTIDSVFEAALTGRDKMIGSIETCGDYYYHPKLAQQTIGLRLEDLHDQQEKTMGELASWLGLDWDSCLLESTVMGKKWWNRRGFLQISGTVKGSASNRYSSFRASQFDRWRFGIMFRRKRSKWRYASVALQDLPGISTFFKAALWIYPFRVEQLCWTDDAEQSIPTVFRHFGKVSVQLEERIATARWSRHIYEQALKQLDQKKHACGLRGTPARLVIEQGGIIELTGRETPDGPADQIHLIEKQISFDGPLDRWRFSTALNAMHCWNFISQYISLRRQIMRDYQTYLKQGNREVEVLTPE